MEFIGYSLGITILLMVLQVLDRTGIRQKREPAASGISPPAAHAVPTVSTAAAESPEHLERAA